MFNFIKQLLFIDQKTKLISHSKMWSNLGYGLMCWSYWYTVLKEPTLETAIMFAFGMIVIGIKPAKEFFNNKKDK